MDLTLDIEVKSTLRMDPGRALLSYRPLVLSDSGVKGDIVVSGDDRPLALNQRIKVTLEDICGQPSRLYHMQTARKLVHATQILVYRNVDVKVSSDRLKFQFIVPRQPLTSFTTDSDLGPLQQLPSSLKIAFSRPSPQDSSLWHKGCCRINYRICAQLFKDASCLVENVRPIDIFTCAEQQPPLPTEDFPDEYTFLASSLLRSRLLFRAVGTLSISAEEPQPLRFRPGKSSVSTTVRLKTRYLPLDQTSKNAHIAPPPLVCLIKSTLRAMTFISVEPQKRVPSSRDALRSPVTAEVVEIGTCHTQKQPFSACMEPPSYSEQVGREWHSSASLSLFFKTTEYLSPTIVSPLVSRRYSIYLHIKPFGYGHGTLTLQLPLQVLYETLCLPCSSAGEISAALSERSNDIIAPPEYFP